MALSPALPTSPTRLRQIALITPTPLFPRARHLLTTVLRSPVIFTDPAVGQWGLSNILVTIGGDIIEVCAPLPSHWGGSREERRKTTVGRLLERSGEGGYMII